MSTGHGDAGARILRGAGDDYTAYLEAFSIGDFARSRGIENYPSVRKVMENPAYTDFWSLRGGGQAAGGAAADRANHAGRRPMGPGGQLWRAGRLSRAGRAWTRTTTWCCWSSARGGIPASTMRSYDLGALTFTGDTALEFRVKYLKPFFDHYLKDAPRSAHAAGKADLRDRRQPADVRLRNGRWGRAHAALSRRQVRRGFAKPVRGGHDEYIVRSCRSRCRSCRARSTWMATDGNLAGSRPALVGRGGPTSLTYQTPLP